MREEKKRGEEKERINDTTAAATIVVLYGCSRFVLSKRGWRHLQLKKKKKRREKNRHPYRSLRLINIHWFTRMDRRLHAVQDCLSEHCAQTFKTVQGSVSAVTSVSFRRVNFSTKKIVFVTRESEGIYLHNGNVLIPVGGRKVIERYVHIHAHIRMILSLMTLLSVNKYTFSFIRYRSNKKN